MRILIILIQKLQLLLRIVLGDRFVRRPDPGQGAMVAKRLLNFANKHGTEYSYIRVELEAFYKQYAASPRRDSKPSHASHRRSMVSRVVQVILDTCKGTRSRFAKAPANRTVGFVDCFRRPLETRSTARNYTNPKNVPLFDAKEQFVIGGSPEWSQEAGRFIRVFFIELRRKNLDGITQGSIPRTGHESFMGVEDREGEALGDLNDPVWQNIDLPSDDVGDENKAPNGQSGRVLRKRKARSSGDDGEGEQSLPSCKRAKGIPAPV